MTGALPSSPTVKAVPLPAKGDHDHHSASSVRLSLRSFSRVGKAMPKSANLEDAIPADVFKSDDNKAFKQFAATTGFTVAAWLLLHNLPWFLLPLGWVLAGFVATGWAAIGRDCSQSTWSASSVVNEVVSIISNVPLMSYAHSTPTVTVFLCTGFILGGLYLFGLFAVAKFWLLPYIASVYWIHAFKCLPLVVPAGEDDSEEEHQAATASMKLPSFLRQIVNNYNVSLPESMTGRIPSYNVFKAYKAILAKFKDNVTEVRPVPYFKEVFTPEEGFAFWFNRIDWIHMVALFGVPALAIHGYYTTPIVTKTVVWSIVWYFFTGMGITAGYHRLWSHRAYKMTSPTLEKALIFLAAGAVQGSCKWWSRNHRAHHRYTDSPKDPYSAKNGFWYAHMGWMFFKPNIEDIGKVDISDLKANPAVVWQHKNYFVQVLLASFIIPCLVAGIFWGDFRGGFYFAGALRLVCIHHSTFCVNSVAHFFGDHTFDDERTPKDHILTALITLGEGYHNFHHEFPNDYRNGIRFFDFDPTKWLIGGLHHFGLVVELQQFPTNEIEKGRIHMKEKKINEAKEEIDYPDNPNDLPEMSWDKIKAEVKKGVALIVIDDIVHDITEFLPRHPGGHAIVKAQVGTDGSANFFGRVYKHSNAAKNLLATFRVARLEGAVFDMDPTAARMQGMTVRSSISGKKA